jgi:hypothetical protein
MGKLVNDMIAATRNYLEASWWWNGKPAAAQAENAAAVKAQAGAAASARTQAPAETSHEAQHTKVLVQAALPAEAQTEAQAKALADAVFADSNARAAVATAGEVQAAKAVASVPSVPSVQPAQAAQTAKAPVQPSPASADTAVKSATAAAAKLSSVSVGESTAATTGSGASAAATVVATALDRDFRYRLARKNVHIAFANLGQAFQRMMLEPKAHQKFVAELNDLLIQSHVLASQITAAAPLLQSLPGAGGFTIEPVHRTLDTVRDNLTQAQGGAPPRENQQEQIRQLTRELDAMVVAAERASNVPSETVHDLKLLAHQCKQMLAASTLIRKDASLIHLPA